MHPSTRRTLGVAAALFLASCFGDSTGPALRRRVPLSIAPVFDSRDAHGVLFDKVRVHLVRPGTNELVMDTVVDFPSTADSVVMKPILTFCWPNAGRLSWHSTKSRTRTGELGFPPMLMPECL